MLTVDLLLHVSAGTIMHHFGTRYFVTYVILIKFDIHVCITKMSHHVLCDFSNYLKNLANVQFERIIIAVYEISCRPW